MATPEELEARAETLRGYARSARTKATALHTHLDVLVKTAQDEKVWKGAYPREAAEALSGYREALRREAGLLGQDADAWTARARQLDADAKAARSEATTPQESGG